MTDYQIFISPQAAEQISQKLIKRGTPQAFLRIGVKGGSCSGLSYCLEFEDNPSSKDLFFKAGDASIVVDKKSILYLNGMTLDWEKTVVYQGFKFINPNIKSTCGCGMSFSVKAE